MAGLLVLKLAMCGSRWMAQRPSFVPQHDATALLCLRSLGTPDFHRAALRLEHTEDPL